MFEQQLYEQEAAELHTKPGDLFHNYEIRNWNFTPRLYKILGISTVLNIIALVVIGSSGMLTTRGCDSPFVGRVCQVLDTVYIGSVLFGTDREYADVDYTKTELEDADVTFVDVTGVTPPLTYPAGYFQLANPEQYNGQSMENPTLDPGFLAPGIPSSPMISGGGLLNTPPIAPPVNKNPIEGDLPTGSPLGDVNDNPTVADSGKGKGGKRPPFATDSNANTNTAGTNTNTNNPTVPATQDESKEDQFGVFINKRPLKDKAAESLQKIETESLKIDTPFKVIISATLGPGKDGKTIVLKNPRPLPSDPPYKNDPVMEKFVQDWILAVGDAGWFGYLDKLKTKKVVITVEQTDTTFVASVRADQPSENDARQAASGLGTVLSIAAPAAKGDEQLFLQKASVTSEGKTFILNFNIEKPLVQEMIMRKLAESKDKEPKPSGNASISSSDNTAER